MPPSVVKLITSDNETFEVPYPTVRHLAVVRYLVDDLDGFGPELESIPLPSVHSEILKIVIDWADHHKDDSYEDLNEDEARESQLGEWDKALLDSVDNQTLRAIMCAANYLEVKGLMNATAKVFAQRLEGLSAKQMREVMFH
ncbi:hypothetical protein TYRP_016382 [Tyrophagus putrescentiae]|nr:hypothetical protein TYRP_016382 [Tyrophagus putrescentiae]